jgi:hypothetical protein
MDDARGALLSVVADFRLRGTKARYWCSVMLRGVRGRCSQKHSDGALLREEKACLDCLIIKNRPEMGLERPVELSTMSNGSTSPHLNRCAWS